MTRSGDKATRTSQPQCVVERHFNRRLPSRIKNYYPPGKVEGRAAVTRRTPVSARTYRSSRRKGSGDRARQFAFEAIRISWPFRKRVGQDVTAPRPAAL